MDLNELKQEAEEYAQGMAKYYESNHGFIPSQFEKYLRNAYISSAEPREKRIAELEEDYKTLQTSYNILKDNDEKIIKEMGEQIEKMKCCGNCKYRDDMTSYCKKHKKEIYIFMVDSKCNDWKLFD